MTAIGPFKSLNVTDFGMNRKPVCNCLLMNNTTLTSYLTQLPSHRGVLVQLSLLTGGAWGASIYDNSSFVLNIWTLDCEFWPQNRNITLSCGAQHILTQVTWLVITEVRSESFGLVTQRRHYNARSIYASLSYVANIIFSSSSMVSRAFSARCVYSTFGYHPHSSARLPLCRISFLSRPPLLS